MKGKANRKEKSKGEGKKTIKILDGESTILLHVGADKYIQSTIEMLRYLVEEREMGGAYITVSKPYAYIMDVMEENNISTKNLFFIDCISQMGGGGGAQNEKCVFTNPVALPEIMVHLTDQLKKVKTPKKFLFLDCLSTLLVYNNEKAVREFTMWLLSNVELRKDMIGILVAVKEDIPPALIGLLTAMCKRVIDY